MSDIAFASAPAPAAPPAPAPVAALAPAPPVPPPPVWTAELERLASHPQLGTIHGVKLASLPLLMQIASHLETLAGRAAKPVDVSVTSASVTGLAEALGNAVETGQSAQYDAVRSKIDDTNAKVKVVATAQEETKGALAQAQSAVSALGAGMEAKFLRLEDHIRWSREQFMQIDAVRLAFESQLHERILEFGGELARAVADFETRLSRLHAEHSGTNREVGALAEDFKSLRGEPGRVSWSQLERRLEGIEEELRQLRHHAPAPEADSESGGEALDHEKHARRSPPKTPHK